MKVEVVGQAEWVGNVMNMTKNSVGSRMRGASLRMKLNVALLLPILGVVGELVGAVGPLHHPVLLVVPHLINCLVLGLVLRSQAQVSQTVRVWSLMALDTDLLYPEITGEAPDINHELKQYLHLVTQDPLLSRLTRTGEGVRGIALLAMENRLEIPSDLLELVDPLG